MRLKTRKQPYAKKYQQFTQRREGYGTDQRMRRSISYNMEHNATNILSSRLHIHVEGLDLNIFVYFVIKKLHVSLILEVSFHIAFHPCMVQLKSWVILWASTAILNLQVGLKVYYLRGILNSPKCPTFLCA